ncbi:MAG: hypothetical protein Q4C52_01340 [Eubacteriales bacterium]|nr:hypothetical protein [Eubacteriales bacterium]
MAITREMLFPLAFYKKAKFNGSKGAYNYRIEKHTEEGADEIQFMLTIWEGPECYDATRKEKKTSLYPFSDEGMEEIMKVLNSLR